MLKNIWWIFFSDLAFKLVCILLTMPVAIIVFSPTILFIYILPKKRSHAFKSTLLKRATRIGLGVTTLLTTVFAQVYLYAAWLSLVISFTKLFLRTPSIDLEHSRVALFLLGRPEYFSSPWVAWLIAIILAMAPIGWFFGYFIQDKELTSFSSGIIVSIIGVFLFLLFAFAPSLMLHGWAWVPFVKAAVNP